jgi:hypothetical protein
MAQIISAPNIVDCLFSVHLSDLNCLRNLIIIDIFWHKLGWVLSICALRDHTLRQLADTHVVCDRCFDGFDWSHR